MTTTVFPALRTTDAAATIALLVTLGFTERVVIRNEQDPELVEHAEYALGDTGGIKIGRASCREKWRARGWPEQEKKKEKSEKNEKGRRSRMKKQDSKSEVGA